MTDQDILSTHISILQNITTSEQKLKVNTHIYTNLHTLSLYPEN